jgi:hypothetical protein
MFSGSDRSRAVSRQPSPKVSADRLPAPLRLSHSQRAYLAFATSVWRDNLYYLHTQTGVEPGRHGAEMLPFFKQLRRHAVRA